MASVIGGVAALAITVGVASVAAWRGRRGRGRLEPVDAFVGLAVLVWGSVVGTTLATVVAGQGLAAVGAPPLLAAVVGTALGGATAAGFAIARCTQEQLGLRRLEPGWSLVGLGLVPAFLLLGSAWVGLLERLGVEVEAQALLDVASAGGLGPGEWAALAYGAVGAPVVEELVFRGLVQSALGEETGPVHGAVGAGVLFGLMHLAEPAAVGPLVVMGVVLGLLRLRSRSLGPAVALHVGNNGLALGLAVSGVVGG